MKTDHNIDHRLRRVLREALDSELGPHPTWADSPAANRVAAWERTSRRRWPLRMLGVAALIGIAGGAALFGTAPEPRPDLPELGGSANGWIAFTAEERGESDIWLVALDQDARRAVGTDTDTVRDLCPAFSPDGRSLAFGRTQRGASALVVADVAVDGTVSERTSIDVGERRPPPCPVWSPNGVQIAFGEPRTSPNNAGRSAEGSEVWIVTLTDRGVVVLPDLLATDLEWSPDGKLLAIASGRDEVTGGILADGRIHVYAPSSGAMRALEATLGARHLTWSPDGRHLAYTSGDNGGAGGLRVIDVQTEELTILTDPFDTLHGIGPVWSPDGQSVAFQRQCAMCGEGSDVVLVSVGDLSGAVGRGSEVIVPLARGVDEGSDGSLAPFRVTWSPDGAYLLSMAWGLAPTAREFVNVLVAVPIDPPGEAIVLFESDSANPVQIVPYDGYDDTTLVPIQTWGRVPSD